MRFPTNDPYVPFPNPPFWGWAQLAVGLAFIAFTLFRHFVGTKQVAWGKL